MAEVQNHGFIFENWIKKILGVEKVASKYTQKWDIPNKIPVSVKFMGLTNALEFGSTVRIWEINKPFILVIGRWKQTGDKKIIKSIDEINITPEILSMMKGEITLEEIKEFDKIIKKFSAGKKGQKEAIEFAKKWKSQRKDKMGLLTITHKIDSKNQRRIQCNLNYRNYIKLFKEPSHEVKFKGEIFDQEINHGARIFNKKN
ncbi:hypothetical protein L6261_00445 [Candidatus Parcubacteria bacterium]|nr:hypothetical protein [Candidatus Parcubacteria bacterium]